MVAKAKPVKGAVGHTFALARKFITAILLTYVLYSAWQGALESYRSGVISFGTSVEEVAMRWVRERGCTVRFKMGRLCRGCMRDAVATQDIPAAGIIVTVPVDAMIELPDFGHMGFSAEYARDVVKRMHLDPSFNETFGVYLKTLPSPDEVFTPEVWHPDHVTALQTPELEILAEYARKSTEEIYYGNFSEVPYAPLAKSFRSPDKAVPLETFKYVASLLSTRYFGIDIEDENGVERKRYYLAPIIDLCNHANTDKINAWQTVHKGVLKLRALRPIKAGEAIRFNYQPGVVHRNDMSLLIYGFIHSDVDPPLMCSVDLPTYNRDKQYTQTPEDDASFYGPQGAWNTEEEYKRLGGLLAATPTTEGEDVALLQGGKLKDWRERVLVEYRILRKKAIRNAMGAIARELQKKEVGGEGQPMGQEDKKVEL